MKRIARIILIAAAAFSAAAGAQTQIDLATQPAVEVQRLAPQLVAFAGGEVNFQNLALGLSLGLPVTLTTGVAPGLTQVVTFQPTTTMTPLAIAQTLEAVRQQLIALGIASPNAQQLGTALVGGTLGTPAGTVAMSGVVAINGTLAANLLGQPVSASFLPGVSNSLVPRNVSDSSLSRFISDTPARPVPGIVTPGTAITPVPTTGTAPFAAAGASGATAAPATGGAFAR